MDGLPKGFSVVRSNDKGSYREGPDRDFRLLRARALQIRIVEGALPGFFVGLALIMVLIFALVGYALLYAQGNLFGELNGIVEGIFVVGLLCAVAVTVWRFVKVVPSHVEMSRDDSRLLFVDVLKGETSIDISEVRDVEVRAIVTKTQKRMGKTVRLPSELEEWTPPNGRPVLTLLTHDLREIGILTLVEGGISISHDKAQAVVHWLKEELELNDAPSRS